MTPEDRQLLREAARRAMDATPPATAVQRALAQWALQTSCSFRRIGCHGDGDVLCATTQRSDGHPDLLARPGVLEYIVAAQPRVVLALLDALEAALGREADHAAAHALCVCVCVCGHKRSQHNVLSGTECVAFEPPFCACKKWEESR